MVVFCLLGILLNLLQYQSLGFGKESGRKAYLLLALCLVPYSIMGMYMFIYALGFFILVIAITLIVMIER